MRNEQSSSRVSDEAPASRAALAQKLRAARSFEAHPRIDERVDEVGEQIHDDVGDGDQQNAALQQRIVARFDGLHGQAARCPARKKSFR